MTTPESCKGCGCTNDHACPAGCYWVKPGLCSACAARDMAKLIDLVMASCDFRAGGTRVIDAAIGARPCRINVVADQGLTIVDHIGATAFLLDGDGPWLAPQYEASELIPLFEKAA